MQQDFRVHAPDDVVGVAVHDIEPGPAVRGRVQNGAAFEMAVTQRVPLGHNVALRDDMTLDEAADLTEDLVARTASGQWAAAEILGHKEFVLTRLHRTA